MDSPKQIALRYHLDNRNPVDLIEFTQGLQALHDEYVQYVRRGGEAHSKARLNIYKVEEGSIIFELIEALPSLAGNLFEGLDYANTMFQFGEYLRGMLKGLAKGEELPAEGRNTRSLGNISAFVQSLASNPNSKLDISIIERIGDNTTIYKDCTIVLDSTEGNAIQNRANHTQLNLEEETPKTEESKRRVLLRLMQINNEQETHQDRGIIEAFNANKKKLLFDTDEVKREITEGDENFFKYLYEVDATALYNSGRIVAYRITKVHTKFDPYED